MSKYKSDATAEEVHALVQSGYTDIALGKKTCCCSSRRHGQSDPTALAKAVGYDAAALEQLPEGANMGLSCGNPLAIAGLQAGESVLDLGCGGGFDVFQAAINVGASGQVIGVDMTTEMIELAQRNNVQFIERSGLNNVTFHLANIEKLPLDVAAVDVVISNCVINLSPHKKQVWGEIFRVLRPGGKVAVSDLALLQPLPAGIQDMAAALVGCVGGAILVEETRTILEELGFTAIDLVAKSGYVRQMLEWNDPLYHEISNAMPAGEHLEEYIVSLSITAEKLK